MHKETKLRSVVKAVCWRFIATATTFSLVWLFTGKIDLAATVGGLEVFLKLFFYFLHERGWEKLRWGRHEIHPVVVWITGLSGSGKTEIAKNVTQKIRDLGFKTDHLDGETIRELFPKTGFTREEVNEHIKRVGHLASRLERQGVFVVASFISPYSESRDFVRQLCNNLVEVHLTTPVETCEKRDRKNLYSRARAGEISHLPGVDVTYEVSDRTDLDLDTTDISIEDASQKILKIVKTHI